MSAEILCVGTELLLGDILNSNARWLALELASLGVPHHRQVVVGDNRERLMAAVREAAGRCRLLITTGGLGPTADDLTTEAIAAAFAVPLVEHPAVWADIQAKLGARGRPVAPSNRRQALLPEGAAVLPNPTGTAPGMIWSPQPGFTILTFPGVPMEMRAMWHATAIPWLREAGLAEGVFLSRRLHVWGIGESLLAEQVADLLALANPTVAPYAGGGLVTLRVTARGADATTAEALLEPVERDIRSRIGAACFGADDDSLASVVVGELARRGQTLAVAESCTGGGLGAALAAVPGASECWLGGVMAYANAAKRELLGVPGPLLERWGAVSDPVAMAMAEGARDRLGSDWAVATTGIAGPGGATADKPVGLVHVAVVGPAPFPGWSEGVRFGASRGRQAIQALSVGEALNRLRLSLLQTNA
ncbi:MAG: competence/damage-inducible protein A [Cyanobacteriota bacterium]